jgi:hypothetical protein
MIEGNCRAMTRMRAPRADTMRVARMARVAASRRSDEFGAHFVLLPARSHARDCASAMPSRTKKIAPAAPN